MTLAPGARTPAALLLWALLLVAPVSCSRPWTFAPGELPAGAPLLLPPSIGTTGSAGMLPARDRPIEASPPVGSATIAPGSAAAVVAPCGGESLAAPCSGRAFPGPSPAAGVFGAPAEPAVWLAPGARWDSPPAVVPSLAADVAGLSESPSQAPAAAGVPRLGLDTTPVDSAAQPPIGESAIGESAMDRSAAGDSVGAELRAKLRRAGRDVWGDYRHYYGWTTLRDLALGVALAAPVANTSLDDEFQDWYQADVRSAGLDDYARFWKPWGEGQIFIPAFAGLAVACKALDGRAIAGQRLFGAAGDYSWRVTRGYLVGAPPMLLMQALLGGSRPGEASVGSQWKPFDDTNAVSGHAFMGAVPWITAARMTERPLLKCGFYVLSTHTAWSRLNDDDHYLSQICLGWWMAYLACRAVDETAADESSFSVQPVATRELNGFALVWRR